MALLDVELFKDRNLRVGTTIMLFCYLIMGSGLFAVSLYRFCSDIVTE